MAIYSYHCENGHTWEVLTTISHDQEDTKKCPECGKDAVKEVGSILDRVYTTFDE